MRFFDLILFFVLFLNFGCKSKKQGMSEIGESRLTFNKETDCFEGSLILNNKSYDLSVSDFEINERAKAEILAIKISGWIKVNLEKSKEFVAEKLLKLKNEDWLLENEKPLGREKFIESIEFDGILAFSGGNFEIYFKDNNLFGGHTIIVDINESFEFEDVNIAG